MSNFGSLVGAFMQSAMAPSAGNRIGSALEQLQRSGFGGMGGGSTAGGPAGILGGILDMVRGSLGSAAQHPGQAGGLGAVLGSLMGGGTKGAVQGGMMAVLASVAMKALTSAGEEQAPGGKGGGLAELLGGLLPGGEGASDRAPWTGGDMPLGMRPPQNAAEEEALESTARLVLKGMINAAKSDGQISPQEMQRIVGKLQESGADDNLQQWVIEQMQAPLNVQAFAAELPNQEVAAQVYTASLLAVEVDTDAEKRYLQQLAELSGLHPLVVGQIHRTLGVTA